MARKEGRDLALEQFFESVAQAFQPVPSKQIIQA